MFLSSVTSFYKYKREKMAKARTIFQQRVCVQMENYPNYITKILYDEYQLGNSCDLVIKTGPEKHESFCHKIVLAFSSDFLQQVLSTVSPGTSPVLLLPDIRTDIVDYLMVFMYSGQVRIPSEKYSDFVDACRVLQLKGMSWNEEEQEIMEDPEELEQEVHSQGNLEEETGMTMSMETNEKTLHFIDDPAELDSENSVSEVIEHEMIPDYIEEESDTDVFELHQPLESNHSKVRLKSDYLKNPFNATKVFRLPNSSNQLKVCAPPIIKHQKFHVTGREPQQKITLNDSIITSIREKLIAAILGVYKDLDLKLMDVQLVVKDNKLQKGVYQCSLCDKMISVVYTVDKKGKFRQWVNSNLKRHVIRAHTKNTKK